MPLNIDFQQIFLHLFNFTLLFGILYFLLYQPVKDFMDKRAAHYADMERQAQDALDQASRAQADCEAKLAKADEEIRLRGEEALRAASQTAEAQVREARMEAARILEKARAEAQAEGARITEEARAGLPDLVTAAVEKLMSENTSAAYDQFLAAAREEEAHG